MTDDQLSQTAEAVPPASDEDELRAFGYEPQLERSMGAWSSFSISISCMCVTAGVFTTFAYSLGMVGPVFVWTWLIVSIGQLLVALVLAELAGRMPISGYAYQWTSRLINSHYGWFVGWAGLMAFIPGFTGLNFGLAPVLLNRLGLEITATSTLVVVHRGPGVPARDQSGRSPHRLTHQQRRRVRRRDRPLHHPHRHPADRRIHHQSGSELQLPDHKLRRGGQRLHNGHTAFQPVGDVGAHRVRRRSRSGRRDEDGDAPRAQGSDPGAAVRDRRRLPDDRRPDH